MPPAEPAPEKLIPLTVEKTALGIVTVPGVFWNATHLSSIYLVSPLSMNGSGAMGVMAPALFDHSSYAWTRSKRQFFIVCSLLASSSSSFFFSSSSSSAVASFFLGAGSVSIEKRPGSDFSHHSGSSIPSSPKVLGELSLTPSSAAISPRGVASGFWRPLSKRAGGGYGRFDHDTLTDALPTTGFSIPGSSPSEPGEWTFAICGRTTD